MKDVATLFCCRKASLAVGRHLPSPSMLNKCHLVFVGRPSVDFVSREFLIKSEVAGANLSRAKGAYRVSYSIPGKQGF